MKLLRKIFPKHQLVIAFISLFLLNLGHFYCFVFSYKGTLDFNILILIFLLIIFSMNIIGSVDDPYTDEKDIN
jgi:hypothetical protein